MPSPRDSPTLVYTDGACSGNPGPGGWAWAVPNGRYTSGAAAHTTNQRMEITAAYEAVRALEGRVQVVSDSTYVVHCFRDRWWEGWQRRGWKNSKKEPVANRDLWEPFVDLVQARGDVTFSWVKGHSGDPMNDLVDRLAVEAAVQQVGREGVGEPDDLGPPDDPRPARSGRDRRLPAGRLVLVSGHRPERLGGYGDTVTATAVRAKVGETLAAMVEVDGPLTVVTGLRLGAEQLGAEAAIDRGLPFVAVLPFPDPDAPWPAAARQRFAELCAAATAVVTLEPRSPATKQLAGAAVGRRDAWLAEQVDAAVVVWDHDDDAVGRSVRSLEDHLGHDQVLLVHP
ncbi:MAG: RNase H family protein [Acidimicrobiales bacterium]|nr:RNase H family protein [Acidimicrobiales bacterium]